MSLLSKSRRYYFDQDAIAEPAAPDTDGRYGRAHGGYAPPGQVQHKGILAPRDNVKRSGNKVRKTGAERGCPEGSGSNVCGSVPWEGSTRNKRSVWTVSTKPYEGAHFATFPQDLIEPCILAGSRPGDIVLDPFMGSGTTAQVALELGRQYLGCELNPEYEALQRGRIRQHGLALA